MPKAELTDLTSPFLNAADQTLTLRVEVRGELAAILSLAEGAGNAKSPRMAAEALSLQIKMVAGGGFEPPTFRL